MYDEDDKEIYRGDLDKQLCRDIVAFAERQSAPTSLHVPSTSTISEGGGGVGGRGDGWDHDFQSTSCKLPQCGHLSTEGAHELGQC